MSYIRQLQQAREARLIADRLNRLRHEHITRIKIESLARIAAQSQGLAFLKRQVG
jgi:hypothetical protein